MPQKQKDPFFNFCNFPLVSSSLQWYARGVQNMEKVVGIYQIENTKNHHIYVGQSVNVLLRLCDHKSRLRSGKHANSHLQRAWNKYGEQAFRFRLLEKCEIDELNAKETFWTKYFSKIGVVYNIGATNRQGTMSEEKKQKISKALKGKYVGALNSQYGKKHDEAWREHIRIVNGGENCYWFGKHRSKETREKISQSLKGYVHSAESRAKKSKPVLQFDLDHNFIREWCSGREAGRELGIDSGRISQSCIKHYRCGNYYFEYK